MLRIVDAVARRAPASDAQRIFPNFPCSSKSYWCYLPDDSNAPVFPKGSRAVWDPEEEPTPGSIVLAVHGSEAKPIIGELSYETTASGQITIITPRNRIWPAARSDLGPVEIFAVMTEVSHLLPR